MHRPLSGVLSQAVLSILLALSLGPQHGYALRKQIQLDSDGRISLGPGALYGNLKTLNAQGYIEEMPFEGDARQRLYRLTKKGWDCLGQEGAYYNRVAQLMVERKLIIP